MTSNSSLPISRRDRVWLGNRLAFLMGPFAIPDTEEVRAAVTSLIQAHPHSRLGWGLDDQRQRWIPGRSAQDIVVEGVWDGIQSTGELVDDWLQHPLISEPLTFVRFPKHLLMVSSHALGDGRNNILMAEAVIHAAVTGDTGEWPSHPSGRFPLLNAALRTFGRHPSLVLEAIRDRYPQDIPEPSGTQVPWVPSRRMIVTSIPRSVVAEMTSRAEELDVSAGRFALLTIALLRALRAAGMDIARDVTILADLRRYLNSDWIDGNFIAAVPFRINADTPPPVLAAMIKKTIRSGRPLANQMQSSMRIGSRRRTREPGVVMADPHELPRLAISDLGAVPRSRALELVGESPLRWGATGLPDGPHGMTLAFIHLPQSIDVTITFDDGMTDAAKLASALDKMSIDLAGLLFAPSGVR